MIIINFKNYVSGAQVLDLVQKIEIYYSKAIVSVPFLDLIQLVKNTTLSVWAQHVDYQEVGRSTGSVVVEHLIGAGATGSLLNHSEHPLNFADIKKTIKHANEVGLKLAVCASTLAVVKQLLLLKPYAIAFEDKKLIATGKSITEYDTAILVKFVALLKESESLPLCGAGITTGADVAKALTLGCKGVLVSSVVANTQNPEKFLKEVAALV